MWRALVMLVGIGTATLVDRAVYVTTATVSPALHQVQAEEEDVPAQKKRSRATMQVEALSGATADRLALEDPLPHAPTNLVNAACW